MLHQAVAQSRLNVVPVNPFETTKGNKKA